MSNVTAAMSKFERIAESIRDEIRRGVLKPGDKLPAQRELAVTYDVVLPTMQRALRLLQDEGWLTSRPTVGVFVNEPPAAPSSPDAVGEQLAELQAVVEDLSARVEKIERHQNVP